MHKLADVSSAEHDDLESRFHVGVEEPFEQLEATGEMTVDAESESFIYRLSTGKKSVYIRFRKTWSAALAIALRQDRLPLLIWGDQTIPLLKFHEEMQRVLRSEQQIERIFPENELEVFRQAIDFRRREQ